MIDRGLRDGHLRGLQLHPRRNFPGVRTLRSGAGRSPRSRLPGQQDPGQRTSRSSCMPRTASAPTSAAKKLRCSNRWKARRASRASSRRSRPASACTASRPPSTTPRPSRPCPGSSATVVRPTWNVASPTTAAPRSSRSRGDVEPAGQLRRCPMGTPFAKLLELAGGVRKGRTLKAVIPGGSSSPVLPASVIMDCTMDYDSIARPAPCWVRAL